MSSTSGSQEDEEDCFHLGDAVTVETKSGDVLQGIIAFMGDVQFSSDSDYVGIRLTGTSVGKGKNDGSVQGIRYFTTPDDKSGMFVKSSNVTRRQLTRLEELRLKRELKSSNLKSPTGNSSSSSSSSKSRRKSSNSSSSRSSLGNNNNNNNSNITLTASAKTPPSSNKSQVSSSLPLSILSEEDKTATDDTDDTTSVTSSLTSASAKSKTRLEEIRERRLALSSAKKHDRNKKSSSSSSTSPSKLESASSISSSSNHHSDAQVQALEEKLRQSQDQCQELQTQLHQTQQQLEEQQAQAQAPSVLVTESDYEKRNDEEVKKLEDELEAVKKEMSERVLQLEKEKTMLEEQWTQNVDALQMELDKEHNRHKEESKEYQKILDGTKKDLTKFQQQSQMKKTSESVHYKERAKLQAELSSMQRQLQEYQDQQITHDNAMEELVLDKESLQEQYEILQDKMEELKIDAETSQIEVEELRLELEQAREANAASTTTTTTDNRNEEEDVIQALSVQNARLREAILRLREQTSMEKLNLTQQLRSLEKEAQTSIDQLKNVQQTQMQTEKLQLQVKELTEMVDQGSAMEDMVEQLSDRVMGLEDDIAHYISTIQELEEAAELAAEMEEAQADEIKALMMDIEGRDTLIRNLHEAIGIQRKRELDFGQTVTNYRSTVTKLKTQCATLLRMQESMDGKSSAAMVASQKALAKAAQYVADSQKQKKSEAQSIQYQIDASTRQHAVQRLERLFPAYFAHTELHSIQGELLLHQVATKASLSLQSISTLYTKSIQTSLSSLQDDNNNNNNNNEDDNVNNEEKEEQVVEGTLELSEEQVQQWDIMEHQLEFAKLAIDAGSHALRWMVMGQWPDQLTPQQSCELATTAAAPYHAVDAALGEQLQILKEEGNLSPKHRSNLNTLSTSLQQLQTPPTLTNTTSDDKENNKLIQVLQDWNPPGWTIMKDIAIAKYTCLAAASMISCAISTEDSDDIMFLNSNNDNVHKNRKKIAKSLFQNLLEKLEMISTEANRVLVDPTYFIHNDNTSTTTTTNNNENSSLSTMTCEWKELSNNLLSFCQSLCEGRNVTTAATDDDKHSGDSSTVVMTNNITKIKLCESQADATLRLVTRLSTTLRKQHPHMNQQQQQQQHALSPETNDAWKGVVSLVKQVRLVNGDADDLNYLIRGRDVEQRLTEAMENDSKLSTAHTQIRTLEKTLSSKSKEISMQNVRLQELEQLLSSQNTNATTTLVKATSPSKKSTNDISSIKEENRVLNEAVEVLQTQVDEYEREIRSLKEPTKQQLLRTPNHHSSSSKRSSSTTTPRKSVSFGVGNDDNNNNNNSDFYYYSQQQQYQQATKGLSLEAAFYRPALRAARADAVAWKVKSMEQQLSKLPPLILPDTTKISQLSRCSQELVLASNEMRLQKASICLLDISVSGGRQQPSTRSVDISLERLREASRLAKQSLLIQ